MDNLENAFNFGRLKLAREYCGLTIKEVAEMSGVTKQAISQFENGKAEPKVETLKKITDCLGFPRQYFYDAPKTNAILGDTYFRSLQKTTMRQKNSQIAHLILLAQIYTFLKEYIEFKSFIPLKYNHVNIDVEELAKLVRKKWELGNGPILNIIDVMERNGIVMASVFANCDEIDAYSQVQTIGDNLVPIVILGSDKESFYRRNFNAAHELGHILMDDDYTVEEMTSTEYREMEKKMNAFAGALLIPKEMYRNDLKGNQITNISLYLELKKKYHVSASALIVRAHQIGAITHGQYQYLMKQMSEKGYRKKEPLDSETPLTEPQYLKKAIEFLIN
ncbi:MAG: XRE family transcriptional regulator, partial [Eubacterium sp.]